MLQWEGNILSVVCFPKIHNFNPITIFSCPDLCGGREPCIQVPGGQWRVESRNRSPGLHKRKHGGQWGEVRIHSSWICPFNTMITPEFSFPSSHSLTFLYKQLWTDTEIHTSQRWQTQRPYIPQAHTLTYCTQPREGYTEEHTPRSHSGTHTQLHRSQRSIHMYSHTYTCPWVTGIQTHTCTTRHTHTHK